MTRYICTDRGEHNLVMLGHWTAALAAVELAVAQDLLRLGETREGNWVPGRLPKPHRARGDSASILYRNGTVWVTWRCPKCPRRPKRVAEDTLTAALVLDQVDISYI